jgi:NSS family neurotransmitter:Na+ symporter
VGLGNVWRFPYVTGVSGGGAFLIVYLAIALMIGLPLMIMEVGLGRKTQLTPIAGMRQLTGSATSLWNLFGWLGVTAATVMTGYYVMLIGWLIGYFWMIVTGRFAGASSAEIEATYAAFTTTPGPVIVCTIAVMALVTLVVRRGLREGLERVARVAMPVLFFLLIALGLWAMTLPGASRGLSWYLTPDFSRITAETLLIALGQAFYSIGIGMAAGFGLGSYLNRDDSDVPGNTAIVVLCDTMVAVLAGLIIFPALFAFGMDPAAGPGLLFVTMTALFAQMPGGQFFGGAFFFLLVIAGLTSVLALFEVIVATLMDLTGMRRSRATLTMAAVWSALAVLVILFEGPWSGHGPWGPSLFLALDGLATYLLLPLGGLLLALYTVVAWGFDAFRDEVNRGAGRVRVTGAWRPLVTVLIPIAVALVLAGGFGLLG